MQEEVCEMKEHVCYKCGERIRQDADDPAVNLQARTDHYVKHNATPAQWTDAHRMIQEGMKKSKKPEAGQ